MKPYVNGFFEGRELLKKILVAALLTSVLSIVGRAFNPTMQLLFSGVTVILFVWAVFVVVRQCRCPYCGKIIFLGVLAVKTCPKCRRDLTSGKKVKKSR